MKKLLLPITTAFALIACSSEPKEPEVKGDDYIGVWMNPIGQQSLSDNDVIINDRVIIDNSTTKDIYTVTILAKGIFTEMKFKPDNGLLCAPNDACFQLVDGKLKLGSESGILTYERELPNENQ